VADQKGREAGGEPMGLAWFDSKTGEYSPKTVYVIIKNSFCQVTLLSGRFGNRPDKNAKKLSRITIVASSIKGRVSEPYLFKLIDFIIFHEIADGAFWKPSGIWTSSLFLISSMRISAERQKFSTSSLKIGSCW
jgi:hypothetical protein